MYSSIWRCRTTRLWCQSSAREGRVQGKGRESAREGEREVEKERERVNIWAEPRGDGESPSGGDCVCKGGEGERVYYI